MCVCSLGTVFLCVCALGTVILCVCVCMCVRTPLYSMVVSIPVCHTGDWGSNPHQGVLVSTYKIKESIKPRTESKWNG